MTPPTDARLGAAVLTLDGLLADPARFAAAAEAGALLAPAGHLDQVAAAATDTRAVLALAAPILGGAVTEAAVDQLPEWVRLPLLDTVLRWHAGRGRTCMHDPHPSRPRPVYAAAWRPGLVACLGCAHLVDHPRGSVKDRTCDRCGHITTGPEHGDGIHPCAVTFGPLLFAWGACTGCHEPAVTSTARPAA